MKPAPAKPAVAKSTKSPPAPAKKASPAPAKSVAAPVKPEILQHHGFVHGGVVGALADTCLAWTAATAVGDVVTAGYTLQLLAPAKGERLVAAGEVLKAGRTSVSVQARVYAEEGGERRLVAVALASVARARAG